MINKNIIIGVVFLILVVAIGGLFYWEHHKIDQEKAKALAAEQAASVWKQSFMGANAAAAQRAKDAADLQTAVNILSGEKDAILKKDAKARAWAAVIMPSAFVCLIHNASAGDDAASGKLDCADAYTDVSSQELIEHDLSVIAALRSCNADKAAIATFFRGH